MDYVFDAQAELPRLIDWMRRSMQDCYGKTAVIGISGGKDSSVVAALCVEALGKDRVIGVLMPCGVQHDIDMAKLLVSHLGIKNYEINIKETRDAIIKELESKVEISERTKINLSPRLRMSTLYALSQSVNGRVANTCNL